MGAQVEPAQQRDWQALPAGVLQQIFGLASTWQKPGSCLAAPVCRTWRTAASGCSGIRLLYWVGHAPTDKCFASWLAQGSQQLETLILSCHSNMLYSGPILTALAQAAAAAQAAGAPLRLHTLRDVQGDVDPLTAGQLLAALPRLCCLQLGLSASMDKVLLQQHLAPLQAATQLEELYLDWTPSHGESGGPTAPLLPPNLRRLSVAYDHAPNQDLSHLTKLSFLHLNGCVQVSSSQLPPSLQQLELLNVRSNWEVLEQHKEVVTACGYLFLCERHVQQMFVQLPGLTAADVSGSGFQLPATQAALKSASKLSALTFTFANVLFHPDDRVRSMQAAVSTVGSMRHLRRLHLCFYVLPEAMGLASCTQLTQLRVSLEYPVSRWEQQRVPGWVADVGRMAGLRWLSVPAALLGAGWAWLGGLQQLRVLVLEQRAEVKEGTDQVADGTHISMAWLEGCTREVLPPSLQLLGVTGLTAEQVAARQVRRRLVQALSSSGCEVVVGPDLDEVCDPIQQLAGLPEALQQALMA